MGEGEEMRSKRSLKRQNVWDEWTYALAKRARAKHKYKGVKVGVVEIVEGGGSSKTATVCADCSGVYATMDFGAMQLGSKKAIGQVRGHILPQQGENLLLHLYGRGSAVG